MGAADPRHMFWVWWKWSHNTGVPQYTADIYCYTCSTRTGTCCPTAFAACNTSPHDRSNGTCQWSYMEDVHAGDIY